METQLLTERGITVSYETMSRETIHPWCLTFGADGPDVSESDAVDLAKPGLGEVSVKILGRQYLWRTVDQGGDVIDSLSRATT